MTYERSEHRRYTIEGKANGWHVRKDGQLWRIFSDFFAAREAVQSDINQPTRKEAVNETE
jgi:hypothetical protein